MMAGHTSTTHDCCAASCRSSTHLSDCSMASCRAMKAVVEPGMVRSSGYTKVLWRQVCHGRRQLRGLKPSRYSPACTRPTHHAII